REMLDQVLKAFNITPDYDLDVMRANQTLSHITSRVLERIESIIKEESPDMVLVHVDTTTTFAAALAASYQEVSVGHVEAGLRTYDKYAPYPEELNRQMTTGMSYLHIAPTNRETTNLLDSKLGTYPMHKNPKVRELASEYLNHERIQLIEPLEVLDFHNFAAKSEIILTDSGGIQEEAPSLNKPVLVLRDVTERPEGVESGVLKLV